MLIATASPSNIACVVSERQCRPAMLRACAILLASLFSSLVSVIWPASGPVYDERLRQWWNITSTAGTQSGGPYQRLNLSPQPDNSYTDGTVQSGLTYFYVATAVGTTWSRAGIPMRPRPQFADLLIKTNCAGWKVVLSCSERVRGENSNQSNTSALRNGTPRLSFSDTMGGSRSRQSIFKSESFHASVRSDAAS